MKIYVASSWKNTHYKATCDLLREAGHEILDWQQDGFAWSQVDPDHAMIGEAHKFRDIILKHPRAIEGFRNDHKKMMEADMCVLLQPCGRSAHLEAGWFIGSEKPVVVYIPPNAYDGPDLMLLLAFSICISPEELIDDINEIENGDEDIEGDQVGHYDEDGELRDDDGGKMNTVND